MARKDFNIDKDRVALLVIDMQRHFCDKDSSFFVPKSDVLARKLKVLIDSFRVINRPVVFTRHIDSDNEGNLMLRWWSEKIKEDDPMSEVLDILDESNGSTIVKHQYDGFLGTELEEMLRKEGVSQVVVCGVLTNLCCETTARSAFMRGFEVYFVKDGTATFSKDMHEATLLNLGYGFAILTTIDEVVKAINPA